MPKHAGSAISIDSILFCEYRLLHILQSRIIFLAGTHLNDTVHIVCKNLSFKNRLQVII